MNIFGAAAAINAFAEATRGHVVAPGEIVRRAAICAPCPLLRSSSGLAGAVSERLGALASKHRVPPEAHGRACGVCGCSLMMLLPAAGPDLHADSADEAARRPPACWLPQALRGGA
jgi:hypothetical protein